MDVTSFSPYILLQGEHNKKYVPITSEEFQVLLSDKIHSHILTALERDTPVVGDLNLSLMNTNFRSVVFEHKDFSMKIYLSWSKFMQK